MSEGDDSDDHASLVRLMVHANEFDMEGIHATTNSDGRVRPCPEIIRNVIRLYGEVRGHLELHASGWPSAQYLLDRVKVGYYGNRMASSVGDGKSTESSNHIIEVVDTAVEDLDPWPIWIISGDGPVSLAQALWDIRRDRTTEQVSAFIAEIRVYTITEDSDVEPWIRKNFPSLFYIWVDRGDENTFWGGSRGGDESLFDRKWWFQNVQQNHGVLGADYVDASSHLPEGDMPSLLYLMTFTGLNDPYHPEYGGWGGRYTWQEKDGSKVLSDAHPGDNFQGGTDCPRTVWCWRPKYQNEFAARMDWCVKPYKEANHPPKVIFNGQAGVDPVILGVEEDDTVDLSADGSTDPDGNTLSYKWYVYPEAGTYGADAYEARGRAT